MVVDMPGGLSKEVAIENDLLLPILKKQTENWPRKNMWLF